MEQEKENSPTIDANGKNGKRKVDSGRKDTETWVKDNVSG